MTQLVRQSVDAQINAANVWEAAGAIIGIAAFIPGFNVLWALLVALATLAISIGIGILEASFTETVYDEIRCLFYCHIDENGQMSASQLADFRADDDAWGVVVKAWLDAICDTFGEVGLSDAGVALEEAADCDECPSCNCFTAIVPALGWGDVPLPEPITSGVIESAGLIYSLNDTVTPALITLDHAVEVSRFLIYSGGGLGGYTVTLQVGTATLTEPYDTVGGMHQLFVDPPQLVSELKVFQSGGAANLSYSYCEIDYCEP